VWINGAKLNCELEDGNELQDCFCATTAIEYGLLKKLRLRIAMAKCQTCNFGFATFSGETSLIAGETIIITHENFFAVELRCFFPV
jgi:hypothetical protein